MMAVIFQPTRPLRGATAQACDTRNTVQFQPTRPLRGATILKHISASSDRFQPTRPLRGATDVTDKLIPSTVYFNPRAPCGARRRWKDRKLRRADISTHAPLAGRDFKASYDDIATTNFNPRAPCGARLLTFPLLGNWK